MVGKEHIQDIQFVGSIAFIAKGNGIPPRHGYHDGCIRIELQQHLNNVVRGPSHARHMQRDDALFVLHFRHVEERVYLLRNQRGGTASQDWRMIA